MCRVTVSVSKERVIYATAMKKVVSFKEKYAKLLILQRTKMLRQSTNILT